ncbi:MAG: hypothetical protein AAF720_07100 [Pseudomonadota bacterium]
MADHKTLIESASKAFRYPFNGIIEIRPEGLTSFVVDGWQTPPTVTVLPSKPVQDETPPNHDKAAPVGQLVWSASTETLQEIFARTNALESSYLSGRLVIGGDMSVMARLTLEA